jgi:hypothetical protein
MDPNTAREHFFLVWCDSRMDSIVRHASMADAQHEAERLATANPGKRFYVLQAKGFAHVPPRLVWTDCDLDPEIPF